ncbi:hypothetical protein [Helicobacter sp. 23-1045]
MLKVTESWQFAELDKETSALPCFVSEAKQPSIFRFCDFGAESSEIRRI